MHIIECNKPKHNKIFNFISDKPLSKNMTNVPLYDECLNHFGCNLVCGKQGSGKSSLVMNVLKNKEALYQVYDHIYVFLPSTSRENIEKGSPYDLIPPEQIYDELTVNNLMTVYNEISEYASDNNNIKKYEDKQKCLIIFDDVSSHFKDVELQAILKRLIKNQRHIFTSTIFIMQSYFDLNKQLRQLASNLFIFKLSKTVMFQIFDELIEINKNDYQNLLKLVFQDPHDFMTINLITKQIFRNYDKIMIDDK